MTDLDAEYGPEYMAEVYDELRRIAHKFFAKPGVTMQPTALVNEAYIKLAGRGGLGVEDREAFVRLAARVMRNILVDHIRAAGSEKRGGQARRVTLCAVGRDDAAIDILSLDEALTQLAKLDDRKARLVELRFFGGLTETQAADALGISRSEATRTWRFARAWLQARLDEPGLA